MNYDEKIQALNERITKLEQAENKRMLKKKATFGIKIFITLTIIIMLFIGCFYINQKYIKPYKEKIDYVSEKVNSIQEYLNEKWKIIDQYNPFNKQS